MSDHYILDGKTPVACDLMTWATFFSDHAKRRVAHTVVVPGTYVSTVFLGLDHGFGSSGPPILFETMSFGAHVEYQERYATWDEALDGHDRVVEEVRNGCRIRLWLRRKK